MPKKYIIANWSRNYSSRVVVVNKEGDVLYKEQMPVAINETRNGEILQDPS